MAETITIDRPSVAGAAATVSASALAMHLDCSRTYIGKLETEGVIQRQGDGFPLEPTSTGLFPTPSRVRLPGCRIRFARIQLCDSAPPRSRLFK